MSADRDPLSRLVVDAAEVNRELLARLLQSKVRVDPSRGTFSFLGGLRQGVTARELVVTALLAQQAVHLLDSRHPVGLAPRDIETCTGVQGGTLRPVLKRLADHGLVRRDEAGAYSIPGYALDDVAAELQGAEE